MKDDVLSRKTLTNITREDIDSLEPRYLFSVMIATVGVDKALEIIDWYQYSKEIESASRSEKSEDVVKVSDEELNRTIAIINERQQVMRDYDEMISKPIKKEKA